MYNNQMNICELNTQRKQLLMLLKLPVCPSPFTPFLSILHNLVFISPLIWLYFQSLFFPEVLMT